VDTQTLTVDQAAAEWADRIQTVEQLEAWVRITEKQVEHCHRVIASGQGLVRLAKVNLPGYAARLRALEDRRLLVF